MGKIRVRLLRQRNLADVGFIVKCGRKNVELINELAFKKSVKSFMVIVFGGMGIRMMFIAISIVILLYIAGLDEVTLVASVFFFYILFIVLEINYLHTKQLLNKKTAADSQSLGTK